MTTMTTANHALAHSLLYLVGSPVFRPNAVKIDDQGDLVIPIKSGRQSGDNSDNSWISVGPDGAVQLVVESWYYQPSGGQQSSLSIRPEVLEYAIAKTRETFPAFSIPPPVNSSRPVNVGSLYHSHYGLSLSPATLMFLWNFTNAP